MTDIKSFNTDVTTVTLEDLQAAPDVSPTGNSASNKSISAHIAVLGDGTNTENDYRSTLIDLESGGKISDNEVVQQIKNNEFEGARNTLMSIIADPNISDGQKASIAQSFNDTMAQVTRVPNLVSNTSLAQPMFGETKESELVRIDTASIINEVNEYNKFVQSVINSESSRSSPTILKTLANLSELVFPLIESVSTAAILRDVGEAIDDENLQEFLKNSMLLGSSKEALREAIKAVPIENRMEVVSNVVDIVNEHSKIVLSDDNEFFRVDFLKSVLEDGYYSDYGIIVDNVVSVLDATVLAIPVARTIRGGSFLSKMGRQMVRTDVQPASLSQNYKNTNPEKARAVHEMAVGDATGEASEATYGASRTEAMANDLLPEVANVDGSVKAKVHAMDAAEIDRISPDEDVMDFVKNYHGSTYYFEQEKINMRSQAVNKFHEAFGSRTKGEMFAVDSLITKDAPDGIKISATYGPRDGGYINPQEALELSEFIFRDLGITEFRLLKNTSEGYKPVESAITDIGDYLVSVDYNYRFNPTDNIRFMEADVKRNFFDYVSPITDGRAGTLQRTFLTPHDTLNPVLTKSANVAVDKTIGLESIIDKMANKWSAKITRLKGDRREFVNQIIKEENAEGSINSFNKLKARGATREEMDILKEWREIQDTIYWLENRDLISTLRARGMKSFVDHSTETQIFARPVSHQSFSGNSVKYFDHIDGKVKHLNPDEVKALYEDGGTIAKMRNEQIIGDDVVEFIVSSEQTGKGFLRSLSNSDKVLNYRPGYYQVHYKDPKFIEKVIFDKSGKELTRVAVATAGNVRDADLMAKRMASSIDAEANIKFEVRGDIKGDRRINSLQDVSFSQGRTAQMTRGKRLQDGNSTIGSPLGTNILDPLESLTKSVRSVSRRVNMRDWIEATKNRFLKQYGDVLTETNQFGEKIFPNDIRTIGKPGIIADAKTADARTTYEYIQYMEGGYSNAIDDAYKAIMNTMAETAGKVNLAKPSKVVETAEDLLRAGAKTTPTGLAKSAAFKLYLALNPARQLIVQSHQAVRLLGINPVYMSSGAVTVDLALLTNGMIGNKPIKALAKLRGVSEADVVQMVKDFKNSGLFASVDANNIVRGSRVKLADMSTWGRVKSAISFPLKASQRVGFDAGEQINIATAWLSFRNQALKDGKKLTADVMDDISGLARNWTYNMNSAGDMPYNQNMLNTVMQFLQVPHKSMLANLTNRAIAPAIRARMLALDTLFWGVPTGTIGTIIAQYLPDEGVVRDVILRGAEEKMLNTYISWATDEDTQIDFSSLAPGDIHGMSSLVYDMFTTDLGDIVANSPSGQLFLGGNPRVSNAIRDTARIFTLVDDEQDPEKWSRAANSFLKLSSGMSNMFKYLYANEYGLKKNSFGKVVDDDVNSSEALAQFFGLGTITEGRARATSFETYEKSKAFEEDVKLWYKDKMRMLSMEDLTAQQIFEQNRITGEAWRVWGDSPKARQIIKRLVDKDSKNVNGVLYRTVSKSLGFMDPEEWKQTVLNSGLPQEDIDTLLRFYNDMEKMRK